MSLGRGVGTRMPCGSRSALRSHLKRNEFRSLVPPKVDAITAKVHVDSSLGDFNLFVDPRLFNCSARASFWPVTRSKQSPNFLAAAGIEARRKRIRYPGKYQTAVDCVIQTVG